jgi:hypothetical protein
MFYLVAKSLVLHSTHKRLDFEFGESYERLGYQIFEGHSFGEFNKALFLPRSMSTIDILSTVGLECPNEDPITQYK